MAARWVALALCFACAGAARERGGAATGGGGEAAVGPPPVVVFTIRDQRAELTWERLPALSADGTRLVTALVSRKSGSDPQVELAVIDVAADRIGERTMLITSEESAASYPAEATPDVAAIRARVVAANTWLAEGRWEPLAMLRLEPADEGWDFESPRRALGDALVVEYTEPDLVIRGTRGTLVRRVVKGWSMKPRPRPGCDECEPCQNPAFLDGAYVDSRRTVVLLWIIFFDDFASDACWEPDAEPHAVRLYR